MTTELPGEDWARWLQTQLDDRGWRQADLVRNSSGLIKRDRASKWLSGKEAPTYRLALVAANTLDAPHADALLAAGYLAAEDHPPLLDAELNLAKAQAERAQVESKLEELENAAVDGLEKRLSKVPDVVLLRLLMRRAAGRDLANSVAPEQRATITEIFQSSDESDDMLAVASDSENTRPDDRSDEDWY